MSTSQLKLYNAALAHCGQTRLSVLTENIEARYKLDETWNNDGVRYCLQQGLWNFATRAVKMDYDTTATTQFQGFTRAFDKPTDWLRTSGVCSDADFRVPLLDYMDETDFVFANLDTIYVRYISDDAAYGMDLSLWPPTFQRYVEAYFAAKIIRGLTADKDEIARLDKLEKTLRIDARSKDAQADPTAFPPSGSWLRARHGRGTSDRGNRSQLIG